MIGPVIGAAMLSAFALLTACQGSITAPTTPGGGPGPSLGGFPRLLPTSGPVQEAPGKLLYATTEGFRTLEPSTKTINRLTTLAPGTFATGPAVSPDGRLVAYSFYQPAPDPQTFGGTDLYVMAPDGANQRLVLAHDGAGVSLSEVAWGADGRGLFYTRRGPEGDRIERVQVDGSGRTIIVDRARTPTLAKNGRLAYLAVDRTTFVESIWVANPDGGDPKRLVDGTPFDAIAAPRFSADGGRIAFVAVGGPGVTPPGNASTPTSQRRGFFEPRAA